MTLAAIDIGAILPEIILAVYACVVLLLEPFLRKGQRDILAFFGFAALALAFYSTWNLMWTDLSVFSEMFLLDPFSNFFKLILYFAAATTLLLSRDYLKREGVELGEYYAFILLATCGMMILVSAGDLITVFLGMELMSITLYILVGFKRVEKKSLEASAKYFILGSFSSAILLFGISLLYGLSGSTNLGVLSEFLKHGALENPIGIIALALLVVGMGFKVAVVPFHMWAPDVYEGAPTPVTGFLAVASTAASFAVFTRIFLGSMGDIQDSWQPLLILLSVLSIILGSVVALAQTSMKRMLAYSGIAHAGYALFGLIVGSQLGIMSLMFYMLAYAFMTLGAFGVVALLRQGGVEKEAVSDLSGLARRNPLLAFIMLVFMFSLTGLPPTAGFIGKFHLFMGAVQADLIWLVVIGVVFTAVSAYFYLRVVVLMYMKEPEGEEYSTPPISAVTILVVAAIGVLWLGVYPTPFLEVAQEAAKSIGSY